MTVGKGKKKQRLPWRGASGLANDIRYYGAWMREEAFKRIGHLYPKVKLPDGSNATVIAWLWARTIPCPNPACGVQMPLLKTFQLSKKKNNEHWIKPVVDYEAKHVSFVVQNHGMASPRAARWTATVQSVSPATTRSRCLMSVSRRGLATWASR